MQWRSNQRQAFIKTLSQWTADEAGAWLDERPCPDDIASPIEEAFDMTLVVAEAIGRLCQIPYSEWLKGYRRQFAVEIRGNTYRLDFAFVGTSYMVAVELDGHEWHERTPEQVERRNRRDADLQAAGWTVLHFSGRQILRDPVEVIIEVESAIVAMASAKVQPCLG